MNLILQSPVLATDAVERIRTLCQPERLVELNPRAVRLEGVHVDEHTHTLIAERCEQDAIDHAFVPVGYRLSDFSVLAMDMDSTLINIECIDEIAAAVGIKPQVAAITEAAMRGEIDFAESLRRRVALLEGVPEAALHSIYEDRLRLNPGAEMLLAAARKAGLRTLLVSGGFTFFTGRLKARLGLDAEYSNQLEIVNGVLTGKVLGDVFDAQGKADRLAELCRTIGVDTSRAIAIGDGANDLKMMGLAGLSVAYHAKPAVRAAAMQSITVSGLDGILNWFEDMTTAA